MLDRCWTPFFEAYRKSTMGREHGWKWQRPYSVTGTKNLKVGKDNIKWVLPKYKTVL